VNVLERKELLASLPDGMYVLRGDVTNPAPDRRERHDWRKAATWKAGMKFVLLTVDVAIGETPVYVRQLLADRHPYTHDDLCVRPDGATRIQVDLDRLDALLPALAPDTSSEAALRWVFRKAGFDLDGTMPAAVLRALVLNGDVSLGDIAHALDLANEEGA
jgi:hypothetical protein